MTDSTTQSAPLVVPTSTAAEKPSAPDNGPWMAGVWAGNKVVLQSDDFAHDVALIVDGDFGSHEEKVAYAKAMAEWMNSNLPAPARRRTTATN